MKMLPLLGGCLAAVAAGLAAILTADGAFAQSRTRIWDIELGTPVSALRIRSRPIVRS